MCSHTSASVDGGGAEGLPDDCLTDVSCNEKRNTRAETIALLQQLIQQQDNQTCNEELKKQVGLYWNREDRSSSEQQNNYPPDEVWNAWPTQWKFTIYSFF